METITTMRARVAPAGWARALEALLLCGAASSLLYVGSDIVGSMSYPGYSYASQMFSELLAIGSPVRPFMIATANLYNLLLIAFGFGVLLAAGKKRSLRLTGCFVLAYGFFSALGPFVPMHQRGSATSLTDLLHIVCTAGIVLAMLLFVAFGSMASGRGFRIYSIATILAILVGGVLAGAQGSAMSAGLPTPWFGLVERVNIYGAMLWILVLAVVLLRRRSRDDARERRPLTIRREGEA
jgi:hypothetical protein